MHLVVSAEEADTLWHKLQESEDAQGALQVSMDVVGGELAKYRRKVVELEGALVGKDKELQLQADGVKQKEAIVQRLSEA